VTSDGRVILVREMDERLGLVKLIEEHLSDSRKGLKKQFTPTEGHLHRPLFGQVFRRIQTSRRNRADLGRRLVWWQIRCVQSRRSVRCASQRSNSEIPG